MTGLRNLAQDDWTKITLGPRTWFSTIKRFGIGSQNPGNCHSCLDATISGGPSRTTDTEKFFSSWWDEKNETGQKIFRWTKYQKTISWILEPSTMANRWPILETWMIFTHDLGAFAPDCAYLILLSRKAAHRMFIFLPSDCTDAD